MRLKLSSAPLSYESKQSKYCFDQKLKNRLACLNFIAVLEFLGQLTIRFMIHIILSKKGVDNFEIAHKTYYFCLEV